MEKLCIVIVAYFILFCHGMCEDPYMIFSPYKEPPKEKQKVQKIKPGTSSLQGLLMSEDFRGSGVRSYKSISIGRMSGRANYQSSDIINNANSNLPSTIKNNFTVDKEYSSSTAINVAAGLEFDIPVWSDFRLELAGGYANLSGTSTKTSGSNIFDAGDSNTLGINSAYGDAKFSIIQLGGFFDIARRLSPMIYPSIGGSVGITSWNYTSGNMQTEYIPIASLHTHINCDIFENATIYFGAKFSRLLDNRRTWNLDTSYTDPRTGVQPSDLTTGHVAMSMFSLRSIEGGIRWY